MISKCRQVCCIC